jgi:hypothetical protein
VSNYQNYLSTNHTKKTLDNHGETMEIHSEHKRAKLDNDGVFRDTNVEGLKQMIGIENEQGCFGPTVDDAPIHDNFKMECKEALKDLVANESPYSYLNAFINIPLAIDKYLERCGDRDLATRNIGKLLAGITPLNQHTLDELELMFKAYGVIGRLLEFPRLLAVKTGNCVLPSEDIQRRDPENAKMNLLIAAFLQQLDQGNERIAVNTVTREVLQLVDPSPNMIFLRGMMNDAKNKVLGAFDNLEDNLNSICNLEKSNDAEQNKQTVIQSKKIKLCYI